MTAAIPLPVRQGTPAWLEARRDGIGSSDMPVITGNRREPSLLELWTVKARRLEPRPPDEATQELYDFGHALESAIAARYEQLTGRAVRRVNRMLRHPGIAWAYASLDRVSAARGERRIVELKWAPHRRWTDGPEPVPADVQDQVQWQFLVTGYDVADVAVLNGSRVEVHTIEPDAGYQEDLLVLAHWFRDLVERGIQPPTDGSESTRRTLARLYPRETGVIRAPSVEMDALAEQLRDAKAAAKAAADHQATLENAIRAILGEAPGVDGEGYRVSWTRNADSTVTDWRAVAAAYRRLLDGQVRDFDEVGLSTEERRIARSLEPAELDAIEGLHTGTKEGPRVLRTRFRNEEGRWV